MMMRLNGYKGNDMSLGGGSSSQQQLDPALKELFTQNYQGAQDVASGLEARQFAGFNPDQQQAFELNRLYASPLSAPTLYATDAANILKRGAQYQPQNVASQNVSAQNVAYQNAIAQGYSPAQAQAASAGEAERATAAQLGRGTIRDVGAAGVTGSQVAQEALGAIAPQARANIRDVAAGSFLNQNIQQYMNPYTQAVTEQSLTDLERARQLEQQRTAAQATAAKAFGGSRQGVAEAETNRAYGENAARLVAQQNAAAYQAAQQASEADLARSMQAQQLNQAQDLATTQQSLQLAGQFGLANQDAALRAALANQGIDLSTGQLNTQNLQQAALANQAAGNQMAQFNAANQQAINLANQAAMNQAGQFGAAAQNTAALSNAQSQLQAALANQQTGMQAGLANQQAALQAALANQGAGLTANQQGITAGGQLASAATNLQNLGFAQANQLRDQGLLQQGFSQQQLDAIRNLPLEQQQILNQALGINVGGGSGQTSTSTSRQGLLGLLGIG